MAEPIELSYSFDGLAANMRMLEGLSDRCLTWWQAGNAIFDALERGEANYFAYISPAMYKTGNLHGSLTERHHPEAIREKNPEGIRFGTSTPYARAAASRRGIKIVRETRQAHSLMRNIVAGYIMGLRRAAEQGAILG